MPNNRIAVLNPAGWRLVVLIGVPLWLSAGAVRTMSRSLAPAAESAAGPASTAALLAEHVSIGGIAIVLYILANAIGWPRGRRGAAALQHAVLLGAFTLCVPPILLASQAAPEFQLASTLDYLVTYLLGLAVILGVRGRLELRDAELAQAALKETATRAHLYALRMQMNPHFAFNTLNSIAALLERNPPRARALLFAMSGLFQRTLSASRQEWHTLDEELDIASDYLRIQSERAAQSIDFELSADSDTRQTRIPSLLLQPLIENAVLHGQADGRDRLRVWLRAWRFRSGAAPLRLCIEIGNSASGPISASVDRTGLGLGNTHQRLDSVYGERAQLSCACPDVGTFVVNLELPVAA